jgi:hypothetical protein
MEEKYFSSRAQSQDFGGEKILFFPSSCWE